LELVRLFRLGAERLHDAVAGERLDAHVREMLERLLAAPRRPPYTPAKTDQRIHDQGRPGEADERQARVKPEQPPGQHDGDQRFAGETADGLRPRLLGLEDILSRAHTR